MPESRKVKIYCGKCRQKLDVSELEPFSLCNCPSCGASIRVPLRLGHFLLETPCGSGDFGKVFLASDTMLDRQVCVKIASDNSLEAQARLRREGRIMGMFNHPGILPVYDAGEENGIAYLVLRYLERRSLDEKLSSETLPERGILLNILSDVAYGLAEIHRLGVIHHDVTPGNMLYGDDGEGRLGDFDRSELTAGAVTDLPEDILSRRVSEEHSGGRSWREYASPERLSDGMEGQEGDIYSFGVSCYELLAGVLPFERTADDAAMLNLRRREKYVRLGKRVKGLPRELTGALESALSFSPENRPSAEELAAIFSHGNTEDEEKNAFWRNFF